MIRADLHDSWAASAAVLTVDLGRRRRGSPICALARRLLAAGRFPPEIIEVNGRADVDALANFLGGRPFLLAEQQSTADTAVFGQLAPMAYWAMETQVASYVKSVRNIVDYCNRMYQRCFKNERAAA